MLMQGLLTLNAKGESLQEPAPPAGCVSVPVTSIREAESQPHLNIQKRCVSNI